MAVKPLEMFPADERVHIERLRGCLGEIEMSRLRFGNAVQLFAFIECSFGNRLDNRGGEDWRIVGDFKQIAAKEAVMQVHHFRQAVNGVQANLVHCPSLRNFVDTERWRKARKEFDSQFPGWKEMRDAVGHFSEIGATDKSYNANAVTIPASNIPGISEEFQMLFASLGGTTYKITKNGKIYRLEVTQANCSNLKHLRDELIGSYENA